MPVQQDTKKATPPGRQPGDKGKQSAASNSLFTLPWEIADVIQGAVAAKTLDLSWTEV